jgi:hypothetical protein
MPDERKRTLTADELEVVLKRLDEVMAEAVELRRVVSRQMQEQRSRTKQDVTPARRRKKTR